MILLLLVFFLSEFSLVGAKEICRCIMFLPLLLPIHFLFAHNRLDLIYLYLKELRYYFFLSVLSNFITGNLY